MWFLIVAAVVPAFLISLTATALMRRLAPRWNWVDRPAARKVHLTPTSLGGGVAIWLGVVLPLAAAQIVARQLLQTEEIPSWVPESIAVHLEGVLYRSGQMWSVVAAGTILTVMGLIDDIRNLPWQPRLMVQFCVAGGLIASGVQITLFLPQAWVGQLFTVLWILVLVNAFNFLDNMDGLSSGIAFIAAAMFALVMLTSTNEPRWLVGGVLLILTGSLAGFLCHNWPPAKIFMGDSGSYFIGLMLACMTVLGTFYEQEGQGKHVLLAPLCILAVPLYDFLSVVCIRLLQGRSPFHPDKSHFSHRLVELGLSSRNAVLTIHLATLTTGLGGLLLYRVTDWWAAGLIVLLIFCVLSIVAILETAGRRNNGSQ